MFGCILMFNRLYNKRLLRRYHVQFDESLKINGRIFIKGAADRIKIGANVVINSRYSEVPIGFDTRNTFWIMSEGRIIIGNNVGMSNSVICSQTKVEIEDYVLLGGGVKIYDTDFHSLNFQKRVRFDVDNDRRSLPVLLKKYAFIGAGSIILKGVTIGEKSIIGAGAVVVSDVPDGQIWAGNPARFIKDIPVE